MGSSDGEKRSAPSLRRTIERSYDWIEKRDKLIALWARASSWSVEEGVSLAFNASPEEAIRSPVGGYDSLRVRVPDPGPHYLKLARRAVNDGVLLRPIKPIEFIDWAESVGLGFDDAWRDAVVGPAGRPGRTSPMDLALSAEDDAEGPMQVDSVELNPKSKASLLKLAIGMAVGGYGFDPNDVRSAATKDISDDLERVGVALKRDTILKWLREAAELLPREEEDSGSGR